LDLQRQITRGIDVFALEPGAFLTKEEIRVSESNDAADPIRGILSP
jgi:hypothetical protein